MAVWAKSLEVHQCVMDDLEPLLGLLYEPTVNLLVSALVEGHKILVCGTGGSTALSGYFAMVLAVRFKLDRRALAAMALTDPVTMTAIASDYSYSQIFSRQVEALGNPGDVLIGISARGCVCVNEAVRSAKFLGIRTLTLSGKGRSSAGPDIDLAVPSDDAIRVSEAHLVLVHLLLEGMESELPKGEDPKWKI